MPDMGELEGRATQLLQRLIQFDTVNPPGAEEECQQYLRGLLEGAGFEVELLAAVPGRPNLVARLPAPSGADGPTLCLLGHVDTVLANPAEWEVDPWSGELRDGCVWGRGALDMKSQVAAEVAAACTLAEAGWRPEAGELKLVITADEETGATYGAQWLCSEHADKVRADLIVNEGAGVSFEYGGRRIYPVCVAEKGVFRFTLTAHGRAGHASLPRIGDNALTKLAPILAALAAAGVAPERSPEPDALLTALGLAPDDVAAELGLAPDDPAALTTALQRVEATDPRIAVMLEPLLGVTFAPTMATASEKINVIPSEATVRVDCRVPPGLGENHVRARLGEALPAGDHTVAFAETVIGNRSPIDTPLMETIRSFVADEDPGATIAATALAGFSDSHWFRAAFPDCVAYGFFPQRRMDLFEAMPLVHGANERIPVEDLALAARFYGRLVEQTLG